MPSNEVPKSKPEDPTIIDSSDQNQRKEWLTPEEQAEETAADEGNPIVETVGRADYAQEAALEAKRASYAKLQEIAREHGDYENINDGNYETKLNKHVLNYKK